MNKSEGRRCEGATVRELPGFQEHGHYALLQRFHIHDDIGKFRHTSFSIASFQTAYKDWKWLDLPALLLRARRESRPRPQLEILVASFQTACTQSVGPNGKNRVNTVPLLPFLELLFTRSWP